MKRLKIATVLALLAANMAYAEQTRYVSDQLEIPMRSGKSNDYRILKMVKSGTPVTVLQEEDSNSLIKIVGGQQGWVLSRYLMEQPIDRERLATAEQKAANLDVRSTQLRDENTQLAAQVATLQAANQQLTADNHRLQQEISEVRGTDASKLREDNLKLVADTANLRQNYEEAQQQNTRLHDRSNHEMMLLGAAILLVGATLGLLIPKIRWQKKSGWSSF